MSHQISLLQLMVRWPCLKVSVGVRCLEQSRMSQMPAYFFSKDLMPTNFPGRVRLFIQVYHKVRGTEGRGTSVCYILFATLFPFGLPFFKIYYLPFCYILNLSFSSFQSLSFIALCPSLSDLHDVLSSPWWSGSWQPLERHATLYTQQVKITFPRTAAIFTILQHQVWGGLGGWQRGHSTQYGLELKETDSRITIPRHSLQQERSQRRALSL